MLRPPRPLEHKPYRRRLFTHTWILRASVSDVLFVAEITSSGCNPHYYISCFEVSELSFTIQYTDAFVDEYERCVHSASVEQITSAALCLPLFTQDPTNHFEILVVTEMPVTYYNNSYWVRSILCNNR